LESDAHQRGSPSEFHTVRCAADVTVDDASSHRVDRDFRVRDPRT
jgi:hypothetical protein